MKQLNQFFRYLLMVGCLLTFACSDPCDKLDCGAFGECLDGGDEPVCACDNGYEKDDAGLCELRATSKFVGTWQGEATCVDQNSFRRDTLNYSISITEEPESVSLFQIRIVGLGGLPNCPSGSSIDPILATVSFSNLGIQPRTFCPDASSEFSGYEFSATTGNLNSSTNLLRINYRVRWTERNATTGQLQSFDWVCTGEFSK